MSTGNKCYNCKKGIMVGHNVSHAKNRTRKVFKPNLHQAKITVAGTTMRVALCTKCLRMVRGKDTRTVKMLENEKLNFKSDEISSSAPVASGLV